VRSSAVVGSFVLTFAVPAGRLLAQAPAPAGPRVGGYVQPRLTASGDSAVFLLRRARLGATGALAPWASYKVQVELRTGGTGGGAATVSATDLYVAFARNRWRGTVGQFKVPFGREFLISSTVLELPNRSLASDAFVPGRDVGVMVDWQPSNRVHLVGGAFNGFGINRGIGNGRRPLWVGRITAQAAAVLDVGADVASYADSNAWSLDAALHQGPWTARGEYLRRNRLAVADHGDGWYGQAAYRPARSPAQGVVRVEQYHPSAALGGRGTAYTGGAQYFLRGDDLKVLACYTLYSGTVLAARHDALTLQMQLRY
jgi:phosphate-selective porin